MKLTIFYFEIWGSTDTFITDNWGEREDTQKVLVAICTLDYFSWLYTLIFVQMFFFFSSSLEPLLFILGDRTNFFRATIQTWENYSVPKNGAYSAVFRCSHKHEQVNLNFSFKIKNSGYLDILWIKELYLKNKHGDFVCLWRLKNCLRH